MIQAPLVESLRASGLLDEHPNLVAYVTRGEGRPAYARAFAARLAMHSPSVA